MNSTALPQTLGNICVGIAAILFFVPLQRLLLAYGDKHVNDNEWATTALATLIPLWLLLMGALLCLTATGGFDSLRLGRPLLYALAAGASISLAVVTFVFVGFYVRPGFTPRILYLPVIHLVPVSTMLLLVLSLNPKLVPGFPTQWLRLPWTGFAGLSLLVCVLFCGHWLFTRGLGGVLGIVHVIRNPGPSSEEILAKVAALNPETDFESLLNRAGRYESRAVREAAVARLRSDPTFIDRLATELKSGHVEPAVTFVRDAELSPAELTQLAGPVRKAMERWVDRIPAPNYTTRKHLKDLRRWGSEMFRALREKFTNAGVAASLDLGPVIEEFKSKVEATQ